jgi:membrane protease YdiL (CAAX protease family)
MQKSDNAYSSESGPFSDPPEQLENVHTAMEPVGATVLGFLVTLILTMPLVPQGADTPETGSGNLPLVMTIQSAVFVILGVVLARWRVPTTAGRQAMGPVGSVAVGIAAGGAALVVSAGLGAALEAVGLPPEEQPWLVEIFSDPEAVRRLLPFIVIVGPLAEEVFFRHYALRALAVRLGFPAALVFSSMLFALIHLNLSGTPIYFAIGCVLGWAYHRTGRLVTPLVGHATLNLIVLLASAWASAP